MWCISPISVPRPGGWGPRDRITVPCAKCVACLATARSAWSFRLTQEMKKSLTSYFLTLTYENEATNVCKKDIQDFIKRLRSNLARGYLRDGVKIGPYPTNLRYYFTSEYGPTTHRPHYHGVIFGLPPEPANIVNDSWGKGFIQVGTVTPASIAYVTKYCITKNDAPEGREKCFSLQSSNPGLGCNYLDGQQIKDYHQKGLRFITILPGGIKQTLPRYFKEKLFTPLQKKRYAKQQIILADLAEDRENRRVSSLGEDPITYSQRRTEQFIKTVTNRITKNSKL